MRIRPRCFCGLLTLLVASNSLAQRVMLDDTLSPQQVFSLDLSWQPHDVARALTGMLSDQPSALPPLIGYVPGVEIRLNTVDFVGQQVRIFLSLPAGITGDISTAGIELAWEASGAFLSGSVRPGQETLIYEGVLEAPVTSGTFDFILSIDDGGIPDSFNLEPDYELEVIL